MTMQAETVQSNLNNQWGEITFAQRPLKIFCQNTKNFLTVIYKCTEN